MNIYDLKIAIKLSNFKVTTFSVIYASDSVVFTSPELN